jgi:dTDP-glucose 4,6-dehydratase
MPAALTSLDLDHVLDHTRDLWEELRGGRIFITGGTGFFGSWLLETFCHANAQLELGAEALVLSRDPGAFCRKMPHLAQARGLKFLEGDVRNFPFPKVRCSHVIHAGTTSSAPVPPVEMFETILQGTRRVLDFAAVTGAGKLLFTSSGAVYGKQPVDLERVPEDYPGAPDPCDPNSAYGEGKRAAELLCAMVRETHGIETKIARCFAFVGPHLPLDAHFAIGNFIRDAMRGGPIVVKNGAPFRSYLYAADLAIWLWTILFKGTPARAYNVGSAESLTIAELARTIAGMFGVTVGGDSQAPVGIVSRYVPCTWRAESELGLQLWIKLSEGIERTFAWRKASA